MDGDEEELPLKPKEDNSGFEANLPSDNKNAAVDSSAVKSTLDRLLSQNCIFQHTFSLAFVA